jgi:hypothetical protein
MVAGWLGKMPAPDATEVAGRGKTGAGGHVFQIKPRLADDVARQRHPDKVDIVDQRQAGMFAKQARQVPPAETGDVGQTLDGPIGCGICGSWPLILDMEDLDAGCLGAIDQRLLALQITGQICRIPIGAVGEGLLHINDEKGGIGHFGLSVGSGIAEDEPLTPQLKGGIETLSGRFGTW